MIVNIAGLIPTNIIPDVWELGPVDIFFLVNRLSISWNDVDNSAAL